MEKNTNINFHQTFKPEIQYISAILEIANGDKFNSIKDISMFTGIPNGKSSGKVEPHIFYAKYMGLIDVEKEGKNYKLKRTYLGDAVYDEDPGLQEDLTLTLCHGMMLRKVDGAAMWSSIFMKIMPMYPIGIKKSLLLKELVRILGDKVNTKNIAPFYGSYDTTFSSLNIVKTEDDTVVLNHVSLNKEFVFLYAFILYKYWDELYKDQDEISSIQLEKIGLKNIFGWTEKTEYEVLELLSDYDLIRLNRQLMPYTLLRLTDENYLIDKMYSELC